ncbi:DUF5085 family protein [Aquibacillus kalidii]|uniref:DUF5085 family protein n=1 Tax=Aquibacillus kalidii TaxID=2762597 RepID=UPI001646173B|nr:DUF5085 family protein [Aquibacillus kalidii]
MNVKRAPVIFHNVISTTAICHVSEWHLLASDLRNAVISNGLYGTGPILYQIKDLNKENQKAEYTFYLPINQPIDMPENDKFRFIKKLEFKDGLVSRHAYLDEPLDFTYGLLGETAKLMDVNLQEPYFHIYLDVYGDGIIDVYAPITQGDLND